jgi:DNA invertase Pin-like site-specific DNA recombinase
MTTSELITPQHLTRKALIYIRQSSPHQVLTNQESLRLQYALRERAVELGWRPEEIEIIDGDLGLSGAATHYREGFKELLTRVTLGEVGIIFSVEVQRLSRNCSDWYPLLDICGYKHCLIADRDGVYDPGTPNGRLLLGLKGQLSEMELYTIRARMTAGLLNKAQRGELALGLSVGLVRDADGTVRKEPNLEVQQQLELVFATFLQRRSASKLLQFLNAQQLLLPRHDRFGDVRWRRPTVAAILAILKNPAYAGAFVYGRTRTVRTGAGPRQASQKKLPVEQWRIRVNDKYPAYISWTTYEQIQAMLKDNYAEYDRNKTRGIPRGRGRPCSMGWSIVGNAAIRWWCSTRREPATSVITSVSNTACRSASISPRIPWMPRWSQPFLRRWLPSNSMPTSALWWRSSRRRQRAPGLACSSSSACAIRQHWPRGSSSTSIRPTAW